MAINYSDSDDVRERKASEISEVISKSRTKVKIKVNDIQKMIETEPNIMGIGSYFDEFSPKNLRGAFIKKLFRVGADEKERILRKLGLTGRSSIGDLQKILDKRVADYLKKVEKIKKLSLRIIAKAKKLFRDKKIVPLQKPEEIKIFVFDGILHFASEGNKLLDSTSPHYNPDDYTIYYLAKPGFEWSFGHELMHAISHDKKTGEVGFTNGLRGDEYEGNTWLNEGAAMIGEFALYPTVLPNERDDPNWMYDGYYFITELFKKEIESDDIEIIKALFKDGNSRNILEQKCKKRFNCSLNDLDCLFIGFNDEKREQIRKIILGEQVEIQENFKGQHYKLKSIFPNVKLVMNK